MRAGRKKRKGAGAAGQQAGSDSDASDTAGAAVEPQGSLVVHQPQQSLAELAQAFSSLLNEPAAAPSARAARPSRGTRFELQGESSDEAGPIIHEAPSFTSMPTIPPPELHAGLGGAPRVAHELPIIDSTLVGATPGGGLAPQGASGFAAAAQDAGPTITEISRQVPGAATMFSCPHSL